MNRYTLPFSAIGAADLARVGGKGANLGEMTRAGLPVPQGFCVTTEAFRAFMQASGCADEVYGLLERLAVDDVDAVRAAGEAIRSQLRAAPIPVEVADAVVAAWQEQGTDAAYAVRSSATAEDLPDASFAGQQDTYLNVRGREQLLNRVRDCWISLFTDRAIVYRARNGYDHAAVELSVLVQRMVEPEISGILFTADPVSGLRHIAAIDASYGLGEALVGGQVSPDQYKVDRRSGAVVDVHVGDKQIAIRSDAAGGVRREQLSDSLRHSRVLDDTQLRALADLGTRVEAHYGKPQDIEWAISGGQIYLLQTRPITSLFPLPEPRPDDDALHVYFSLSHAQVMTDPMPPMAHSFWRIGFPFGKVGNLEQENPYLCSAAGRLYVDLTPMLLLPPLRRLIPRILTIADPLSARALREVASREEFRQRGEGSPHRATPRGVATWMLPMVGRTMARLWLLPPEGATSYLSGQIEQHVAHLRSKLDAATDDTTRLRAARAELATLFQRALWQMPPYFAAGALARMLLQRIMRRHADSVEIEAVSRGLAGNVTTEMDLAVGDLADLARRSPELSSLLRDGDPQRVIDEMRDLPGGDEFVAAWERFMARYGMRGPSEIDLSRPGWSDAPASLLQVIVANLQTEESGTHREKHRLLAQEGEAAGARLVEAARKGLFGPLRAAIVRRLVRVLRNLMPVREHPKYLLVRTRGVFRTLLLDIAARLQDVGRIEQVEDIWFLTIPELLEALEQPTIDVHARIVERKAAHAANWQITPPRVITSDGEIPTVSHSAEGAPDGALVGIPVSAGVVEGTAKVLLDPQSEKLSPGEILVAPFTDPGWTPLFINAAGLVMEVGGLMTHGSVVAREYGIPAVVSVLDATKKIKSGERIRVHGDQGFVEILNGDPGLQGDQNS